MSFKILKNVGRERRGEEGSGNIPPSVLPLKAIGFVLLVKRGLWDSHFLESAF